MFPKGCDVGITFAEGTRLRGAAFQEGNADGWDSVDWTEPAEHVVAKPLAVEPRGKLAVTWASLER